MFDRQRFQKTVQRFGIIVLLAVLLVAVLLAGSALQSPDVARAAAPTPVSGSNTGSTRSGKLDFFDTVVITEDTRSTLYALSGYDLVDVQWGIDMSDTNTTTLKLQFSIDGRTWTDGVSIAASKAADDTGLNQFNNFGRYTAVYADVENTEPITLTVYGLAK